MAEIDIDALLKAREEAVGVAAVTLGGHRYLLKPWLSFAAAEAWDSHDFVGFLREVLAEPEEAAQFLETPGLSWFHLNPILDALKVDAGESKAS